MTTARAEELKYFMRAGMRIAHEQSKKTEELAALCHGDEEAGVEVMVGYCKVLIDETQPPDPLAVVRIICGQFMATAPSVKEARWLDRIVERVQQEISHHAD